MRKVNNYICLFICMLMMLFSLYISENNVKAEEYPTITVESKEIHRGQTFEVKLNLDSNPTGISCMQLYIHYDYSVMKLVDVKQGATLSGINMTVRNPDSGEGYAAKDFNILWSSEKVDYGTGTIATLTFESEIDADEGEYDIWFTYVPEQTSTTVGDRPKYIELNLNKGTIRFKKGAYVIYYVDYDWDYKEETVLYKYEWNGETQESILAREFPMNDPSQKLPSRKEDLRYSYTWNREDPWKGVPYQDATNNNIILKEANYIATPQIKQITYKVAPDIDSDELKIPVFADDPYWRANVVDFRAGDTFYYGETLVLEKPYRVDYTFYGWYLDESFSRKFSNTTMPANDGPLILYGYFKYNIREDTIPTILMTYVGKDESGNMMVDLELLDNNENVGISSMLLSIEYEKGVKIVKIEDLALNKEIDSVDGLLLTQPPGNYSSGSRYLFESGDQYQNNTYDTGKFLRLYFARESVDTIAKSYWVNCRNVKSLYVDTASNLWYTHINMKPDSGEALNVDGNIDEDGEHYFTLPIGTVTEWTIETSNGGTVTVTSPKELDINVNLLVSLKGTNASVDDTIRLYLDDEDIETSSTYDVSLVQNQVKLDIRSLCGTIEVKIKLTEREKSSRYLGLFYVDDGRVTEFEENNWKKEAGYWHLSNDGEYLIFYTDHLSEWNIVTDKISMESTIISIVKIITIILPSIALAIIVYGLIIKQRRLIMKNSLSTNGKGGAK